MKSKCLVLFSGGTDSFCSAALSCEEFSEVHLLTFYEKSTEKSPLPTENVKKLMSRYPNVKIQHVICSTDSLVKELSYEDYFKNLLRFGFLNLATPGLSSITWHLGAIRYAEINNIKVVRDGMTKELLHLPGHMPEVREFFNEIYSEKALSFSSPVINWDVPEDQRFVDKLVVDRHGFTIVSHKKIRSTGQWLYERKLLPHPNVKGSAFDRLMQHDCYPFVVYNMLVFWLYEPFMGYNNFKKKLFSFMKYKINKAKILSEKNNFKFELVKTEVGR